MDSKRKNKIPQKEKRGTSHGEKKHSIVVSRGEGRASTLAPLLRAPMIECDYIKYTMFSEIIHHIIISKYTLECTQLKYLLKFSRKCIIYHPLPSKYDISKAPSIPSNPLAIKLNRVIRTVRSPTQGACITIPPH